MTKINEILDTFIYYSAKVNDVEKTEGFFLISDIVNGLNRDIEKAKEFLNSLDNSKPLVQELIKELEVFFDDKNIHIGRNNRKEKLSRAV